MLAFQRFLRRYTVNIELDATEKSTHNNHTRFTDFSMRLYAMYHSRYKKTTGKRTTKGTRFQTVVS